MATLSAFLSALLLLINGVRSKVQTNEDTWSVVELHDTGIDEIDWHDYLKFYWNTPILTASSDPEIHPFLQQRVFPNLNEILKVLPSTGLFASCKVSKYKLKINICPSSDNRFGDIYNVTDVEQKY